MKNLLKLSVKNIIFDLDGTLIDSLPAIYEAFRYSVSLCGREVPPVDEIVPLVGMELRKMLALYVPEDRVDKTIEAYRMRFREVERDLIKPMPTVPKLLRALDRMGIKCGVASNRQGTSARSILAGLGLDEILDPIIGGGDVENYKPHPEMLSLVMGIMDATADDTLYVGDNVIDIETGSRAGLKTVIICGDPSRHSVFRGYNIIGPLTRAEQLLDIVIGEEEYGEDAAI